METQRTKLEKELDELTRISNVSPRPPGDQISERLAQIAEELTGLDQGEHWTQAETKPRIKLDLSKKTFKEIK